ncbi:MAG: 50S ribosomal protein L6 [Bradymonadia bacterium]
MSRIGKLPVVIPGGVTVETSGGNITVKGPKGTLSRPIPPKVDVSIDDGNVVVKRASEERTAKAMHGLARSLINNMVEGVSKGYTKSLDIVGVGYKVEQKKEYLVFSLGYSHPIYYEVPEGLDAKIESATRVSVNGIDRQKVGQAAAVIRGFRPPEPYKGKGVKYSDEVIRRKEGKSGGR